MWTIKENLLYLFQFETLIEMIWCSWRSCGWEPVTQILIPATRSIPATPSLAIVCGIDLPLVSLSSLVKQGRGLNVLLFHSPEVCDSII